MRSAIFLLLTAFFVAACTNDLDPATCDDDGARTVVYDKEGLPYYAGQALIIGSCGPCHESVDESVPDPSFAQRYGAPHDLSWDLDWSAVSAAQLRAGQLVTNKNRGDTWGQVSGGHMPPSHVGSLGGDPADGVGSNGRDFRSADGSSLPTLRTPEGRAILRNWLACRVPVVQGTPENPGPTGADAIGDVVASRGGCDDAHPCSTGFTCGSDRVCRIEPHWSSIYAGLIVPRCSVPGCHVGLVDPGTAGGLALPPGDASAGRMQLVNVPARGLLCQTPDNLVRVVPGDPDHSLLINKLEGHFADSSAVCGGRMPLGDASPLNQDVYVDPLRAWITAGAADD